MWRNQLIDDRSDGKQRQEAKLRVTMYTWTKLFKTKLNNVTLGQSYATFTIAKHGC